MNHTVESTRRDDGIRSYEMARRLLARGHQVTMVCGSYGGGETGLSQPFVGGRRRGTVDGIDIIEFDLAYSNADGFVKRGLTFVKFAMRSIGLPSSNRACPPRLWSLAEARWWVWARS